MKKLNKEQAAWLCKEVDEVSVGCDFYGHPIIGNALYKEDVKCLINECTEKEFPEYNFKPQDEFWSISLSLFEKGEMSDNRVMIQFIDEDKMSINLYPKEFKQFTEGCNKIVEWLKGQEKDFG